MTEKKRLEEKARLERKNKFKQKQHRDGHRVEIWIAPDGTSTEDKIDDDIDDLTKLSAIQVRLQFSLCKLKLLSFPSKILVNTSKNAIIMLNILVFISKCTSRPGLII